MILKKTDRPITERSTHFNPNDFPYDVFGFWEEIICAESHRLLGSRSVDVPSYPLGSTGMRTQTLSQDTVLIKGSKHVTIKASPQRPRQVITMIQAICGKVKVQNETSH